MYDDDKIAAYKRALLYRMLRNHCLKEPATLEELKVAIPYAEPKLEAYLQGLIHLCELEFVEVDSVMDTASVDVPNTCAASGGGFDGGGFDDTGFDAPRVVAPPRKTVKQALSNTSKKGYRLTDFGKRWSEMMVLGLKEDDDGGL